MIVINENLVKTTYWLQQTKRTTNGFIHNNVTIWSNYNILKAVK